jgi:osmotically-inducible protein OsmY
MMPDLYYFICATKFEFLKGTAMAGDGIDLCTAVTQVILVSEVLGHAVIEVTEVNGSVTLKGRVASEHDRMLAEELASGQDGVVEVINQLTVLE